ncbi:MAG TPA: hypothetical protein VGZ27_10825 [Vicinamibacterales bacterium]|nr:hypothetical protein [Vicinamibacterales bacterium]
MSTIETGSRSWRWKAHGNVFVGMNDQERKFTDFRTIESQNWAMGSGTREVGTGRLTISSMLSLEPFTLKKIGSPQVFQTGESFEHAPLVDYQHPHDLFTALGASYARQTGRWTVSLEGDVVGSPALGPEPFMHRASASENPEAPLSHHQLDSTHITPGVVSAGLSRGAARIEASWFRGREPDEDRTDIDLGALDSWSTRGTWTIGPWSAQVSGGHLHNPEITAPGRDMARLTASVAYSQTTGSLTTALFGAWGENREVHGLMDAYLVETGISWLDRNHLYSRAELVTKDILNAGSDPVGFIDFHPLSRVGALTVGYTRDLNGSNRNRFGLGGDVTMYYVPPNLKKNYGGPVSMHVFVRYRFMSAAADGTAHDH